jgi:hypothetical protein
MINKENVLLPRPALWTEQTIASVYPQDAQQENKRPEEHKAETDEVRCVAGNTQTRLKCSLEEQDDDAE